LGEHVEKKKRTKKKKRKNETNHFYSRKMLKICGMLIRKSLYILQKDEIHFYKTPPSLASSRKVIARIIRRRFIGAEASDNRGRIDSDLVPLSDSEFQSCSGAMSVANADDRSPSAALRTIDILNSCSKVRPRHFSLLNFPEYSCLLPEKT
jgi:hypothetical protein